MAEFPEGTVSLLFTDVDRSTELVKRLREAYGPALAEHRALLRGAFAEHGGAEVDTQGDSFFVAFGRARDAVMATIAAQHALAEHPWPGEAPVSVRMGLHTGEVYPAEHGYVGVAVHRAARICTIAHGGQVLLSRSTAGIVDDDDIPGAALRDLGEYQLKDIDRPERISQLVIEGLPSDFPPLRTIDQQISLTGTVTIVLAEGRRMMRLSRELSPDHFGALLNEYQRLLTGLFERMGEAGIGWVGPAVLRCAELCDAAEGGQIFMSQATASLLEDEDLGELSVGDLGEQETRRTHEAVRVHELVAPAVAETT